MSKVCEGAVCYNLQAKTEMKENLKDACSHYNPHIYVTYLLLFMLLFPLCLLGSTMVT